MSLVLNHLHSRLTVFQGVVVGLILSCVCSPFVVAEPKPKVLHGSVEAKPKGLHGSVETKPKGLHGSVETKPKGLPGLKLETPKLDETMSRFFKLGAERKQLREKPKPILSAIDRRGMLRGIAQDFRLEAGVHSYQSQLQSENPKTGRFLQGVTDKSGGPLTGGVYDYPRSPLDTKEHVRQPFHFDVRKLTADLAPDIVSRMDAEIEQARTKTAEIVAREEKEMEPELRGGVPRPDMPPVPSKVKANLGASRVMESEIEKSKERQQQAGHAGAELLKMQMEQGNSRRGGLPQMPGVNVAQIPRVPAIPSGSSDASSRTDQTEREMTAALARVHKQTPSESGLNAQLERAKNSARDKASQAQPGLDAILTHSRSLPSPELPGVPKVAAAGQAQDVVPWDEWHARFAQLAHDPILAKVSKAKNPSGSDTVEITVGRDHHLNVTLTKSSNETFDVAVLDAYRSLNGNPGLEFPNHSQRRSITFLVDNEHKGAGAPSGVESQTSRGDKEVIQYHF